ncbi:MAG TPA: type II secretion system F family protein [Nevskiaceae bacterium]|nr:type II secretion system F family protein [Nevskiaceae bacterium]
MSPVILGVVAVALLLLAAALWLFGKAGAASQQRVLEKRIGDFDHGPVSDTPAPQTLDVPVLGGLYRLLSRAGFKVQPRQVITLIIAAAVITALLLLFLGVLRGIIVALVLIGLFLFFLTRRAAKRRDQLVEQLPGFLENVVRILAAGNTLEESFDNASRETREPIHNVIQEVARQARLGVPLEQALEDTGRLHRIRDFRVIALAVNVNRRYGGSIRNVFRSLIVMIRQRATSAKELKALTAETRFSAMVLAFVSIGLFVYIYLSNPGYYAHMLTTGSGRVMFGLSMGLLVAGVIVIYRMTTSMGGADE